jgi:hypothetical protein
MTTFALNPERTLNMNVKTLAFAAALTLVLVSRTRAEFILDFASAAGTGGGTGATIHFVGGGGSSATMTFPNNTASDSFVITTSNGVGDSLGKFGDIGGTYTVGSVTTVVPGYETAPVTGTGTLTIHDGSGHDLTGTLTWDTIASIVTAGSVNLTGTVNLTSITYSGTNKDLLQLTNPNKAVTVLSFQFPTSGGATDLKSLEADSAVNDSSYSGTISNPEPSSIILFGFGLAGFAGYSWRRRKTPI